MKQTSTQVQAQITVSMPMPNAMPKDDRVVGSGVGFERIRRITGYLVGTLDRFNDAKRAEERDRLKHVVPHEVQL